MSLTERNEALWEQHAHWWQRVYSEGADPEYEEQILPLITRHLEGARHVLDIGCGEGQVARRIAARGAEVVGVDPISSQVRVAHERAQGPRFARARAEALPCRENAFDAVVVCLALEHVEPFEAAIREAARVLEPGGRFVLLLCHPLLQAPGSGWVDDATCDEHYWRIGAYLGTHIEIDEVAPGVRLQFVHRPLHQYVNALVQAGFVIDGMEEPAPPASLLRDVWAFPEAATIPRLLVVRARNQT